VIAEVGIDRLRMSDVALAGEADGARHLRNRDDLLQQAFCSPTSGPHWPSGGSPHRPRTGRQIAAALSDDTSEIYEAGSSGGDIRAIFDPTCGRSCTTPTAAG
jgi:hypothetical protein